MWVRWIKPLENGLIATSIVVLYRAHDDCKPNFEGFFYIKGDLYIQTYISLSLCFMNDKIIRLAITVSYMMYNNYVC